MKTSSFFNRSELTRTLWGFRSEFLMVGLFSMLTNVLMLSPTLYMLQVYDRVMASQSELTLLAVSMLTLVLYGIMSFCEWMRSRLLVHAGVRLDNELSTKVFNASFEAQLNQNSTNPQRAFGDLLQVRQFITGSGIFAFFDTPWTPVYLGVLFFLHPLLGVMGIVFALIQAALAYFGHRHTLAPSEGAAKLNLEAGMFLQSKLRNSEVLESMGMLGGLKARWSQKHQAYLAQSGQVHHLTHRVAAVSKFVRYAQQSLALGAGALLVIDGQLSPGGMIAANVLMTRALTPIDMVVSSWRQFAGMRAAFGRLERLLKDYPERDEALKRVPPSGAVTLRNVVASAPGRSSPILKGINLGVAAGTVTVILGPSGSGKSTLARVLMGIWPEVNGEVLLDDMPLAGWNRVELGVHTGYLPQDIELLEGSIAENIARFGEVDSAKVIEAARCAGLHEMILRFPKGYDTPIGEAGSLLSGGQRQRIGLARAVYGTPTLIVLDEPNANLDDVGEQALARTILELKAKGRTVFLISHRPGAIAVADRLLILRDGQVQMEGPRDAVIAALQPQRPPVAPGQGLAPVASVPA
jgi:ATP-binding cassette subfamily C exporter for protease/lipase